MENKQLLKQLTQPKGMSSAGSRKLALTIPGFEALKKQLAKTGKK